MHLDSYRTEINNEFSFQFKSQGLILYMAGLYEAALKTKLFKKCMKVCRIILPNLLRLQ